MDRPCALPDAKLVVRHDQFQRMLARYRLPEGELPRVPYSLYQVRHRWINPGLAAMMCGLPNNIFYDAIHLGELGCVWGPTTKHPRSYIRVAWVLEKICEWRLRCNFKAWERKCGYLRSRYSWPEPRS